MPLVSIIIAVFNKWELTRQCLKSLADTTKDLNIEVIIIDNASTDITPGACPTLGKQLFGRFQYIRNEVNRNFGPASNQGALAASGDYLLFLNNDTSQFPGWLPPLLKDFIEYDNLAATGSVLLYPELEPVGHTVQHLGVCVSPFHSVKHLYAGIPAASPLVSKRRFFQLITAACMLMPKKIFLEIGMFDEGYINGFEDVDLCARLSQQGYRMTINPESRMIHYESQSPGRHDNEVHNSRLLKEKKIMSLLTPDEEGFIYSDNLIWALGDWQIINPALPKDIAGELARDVSSITFQDLFSSLQKYPYWAMGWQFLLEMPEAMPYLENIYLVIFKIFESPHIALDACDYALRKRNNKNSRYWLQKIGLYVKSFDFYLTNAQSCYRYCLQTGFPLLAEEFFAWIRRSKEIRTRIYLPLVKRYLTLSRQIENHLPPVVPPVYAAWRETAELGSRQDWAANFLEQKPFQQTSAPAFSILLELDNPDPQYLAASLASLQNQSWPLWKAYIIIRDPDPHIRELLSGFCANTQKCVILQDMAEAMECASNFPWIIFMGQHDCLDRDTLAIVSQVIMNHPDAKFIYSDEDRIDGLGNNFHPRFKGLEDLLLLAQQNQGCQLAVFSSKELEKLAPHYSYKARHFLLEYLESIPGEVIHIPHVLYHIRENAAAGKEKPALTHGGLTFTSWMDNFLRPIVPLPAEYDVALISDWIGADVRLLPSFAASLDIAPGREFKLYIIHETDCPGFQTLTPPVGFDHVERLNWAIKQITADIAGIIAPNVIPVSQDWLLELAGCLMLPAIGACAGRLLKKNNSLLHGGYLADSSGKLQPALSNTDPGADYSGLPDLAHRVHALDDLCFFTEKNLFMKLGGFDHSVGDWAIQDYCLRMLDGFGKLCYWWPYADFRITSIPRLTDANREFMRRWDKRVTPCNINLLFQPRGIELNQNLPPGYPHEREMTLFNTPLH